MKIRIELLNDYKYPAEIKKAITSSRIINVDADRIYKELVNKLLQEEEKLENK